MTVFHVFIASIYRSLHTRFTMLLPVHKCRQMCLSRFTLLKDKSSLPTWNMWRISELAVHSHSCDTQSLAHVSLQNFSLLLSDIQSVLLHNDIDFKMLLLTFKVLHDLHFYITKCLFHMRPCVSWDHES